MNVRTLLIGIAFLLAGTASAQVYQTTDENGNPVFSDVPSQDATPVKISPINVMTPVRVEPRATEGQSEDSLLPVAYKISILQPEEEQTFRNTREFPVSVSLEPALQKGHAVAISLDGEIQVRGEQLSAVLTDVNRGAHRVTASVVDSGGRPIITSATVVVHMQQTSIR